MEEEEVGVQGMIVSVYKASRSIRKSDNSLYNSLRSIYEDSLFVREIAQLWPDLPLLANLRCGLWYAPTFLSTCYFKSTDGHTNNCSFSTARLNLHVARLAGEKGGCIIVDSTRRGKRFPDSMSKTIPIWACIINRAVRKILYLLSKEEMKCEKEESLCASTTSDLRDILQGWDCSLHLPLWVSETEKANIENRLDEWSMQLQAMGVDLTYLALSLKKPLRPLWISQRTVIWLNEVPERCSWDFTPMIMVSASSSDNHRQKMTASEFSWHYIPGAGDDEESWARGLTPGLFWKNAFDLISSGPDSCNKKVADIVEKDRVYRAQRGEHTVQIKLNSFKTSANTCSLYDESSNDDHQNNGAHSSYIGAESKVYWIGTTNLAVGDGQLDVREGINAILHCDAEVSTSSTSSSDYLHLPIATSKFDRFSLLKHLPLAINFANNYLNQGKTVLILCSTGEDISICVSLAIITSLFDDRGGVNSRGHVHGTGHSIYIPDAASTSNFASQASYFDGASSSNARMENLERDVKDMKDTLNQLVSLLSSRQERRRRHQVPSDEDDDADD